MPSLIRRLLLPVCALVAVAVAWWWISRPTPVAVVVSEIDRGRVEASIANTRAGSVEACQRTRLSTIVGGRIERLTVKEGDRVRKGQLLIQLWNDDQRAQSTLAATQVASARHRASEACTQAANAEREAQRQSALRARGFVSGSREEAALTEAQARRASCQASRADIDQSEARLAASRVELARTSLYAPFAGTVAKIVGEIGEYSTPSPPGVPTPPAIDLIDDSCLYIKAPMDEVDAPRISAGQPVRITLDALPGQSFAGRVRRVAPYVSAVEKQARTVDIEADFDRPEAPGKLLVGYSADVEVILAVRDDVVRVPTAALLEGGRALVAAADGRLEERRITTGIANWEYSEVVAGLTAGERVVTSLERPGVKAGAHYVVATKSSAE